MIERQAEAQELARTLRARGIRQEQVLRAVARVPRHRFVPPEVQHLAYLDEALPLDLGQTVSQPLVVAMMTELSQIGPGSRVLEIGTGSGYQTAILLECGADVYTIEYLGELARQARERLEALGYGPHFRVGDGYQGWPEAAPFDAIVVTAAPPTAPAPLLNQLAEGGRLVVPEGLGEHQMLRCYRRRGQAWTTTSHGAVRFVPMVGQTGLH